MKQHTLERVNANRQWSATTRPWNAMSLADEVRARCRAPETTVELSNVKVPLRFINGMARFGLLTQSQAERKDEEAITEALLSAMENRLYGKIKAVRYGSSA